VDATEKTIGRARIALVFGGDDNRKGILSTVTAQARPRQTDCPLTFQGPVKFAEVTIAHIASVILPIVDRILTSLGAASKTFEISAVNVGAASCQDLGVEVSGLSGDLPVALAMLSAALRMPLRDDFVATGHIASAQGDIVAVKGIPAKLEAAVADRSIKRFLYGDLEKDRSLDVLSPHEKDASITAIMRARNAIDTKAVRGIDELIAEAFAEEDIVLSSLQQGFFHIRGQVGESGDPVGRAIHLLTDRNDLRFWRLLQADFSTGECSRGTHLLGTYAESFLNRRQYPPGFGNRLLRLVCSLPPAIRRLKLGYPLLDFGRCVHLVQLAGPSDLADVPVLFDAVRGKVPGDDRLAVPQDNPPPSTETDCDLFDTVTAEIHDSVLVHKFDVPIDSARASFVLNSSTARSYDEFRAIIESFFIHLQSQLNPEGAATSDLDRARSDAVRLLSQAFWNHGGLRAALVRGREGSEGGLRSVLDAMTERYKAERRAEYVEAFLETATQGMDHTERVRFARGAMERLGPMLPAELRSEPPERFARHVAEITRAYAGSMASIERLLKTM
jgi:hypothetical protein